MTAFLHAKGAIAGVSKPNMLPSPRAIAASISWQSCRRERGAWSSPILDPIMLGYPVVTLASVAQFAFGPTVSAGGCNPRECVSQETRLVPPAPLKCQNSTPGLPRSAAARKLRVSCSAFDSVLCDGCKWRVSSAAAEPGALKNLRARQVRKGADCTARMRSCIAIAPLASSTSLKYQGGVPNLGLWSFVRPRAFFASQCSRLWNSKWLIQSPPEASPLTS